MLPDCSAVGGRDGTYESAMAVQGVNVYEAVPILLHLFIYLFFRGVGRREVEKCQSVEQVLQIYFEFIFLAHVLHQIA